MVSYHRGFRPQRKKETLCVAPLCRL